MLAVTGDETGLLKLVNVSTSSVETRFGTQSRIHAPAALTCLPTKQHAAPSLTIASGGTLVASLRRDGSLEVWDAVLGAAVHSCSAAGKDACLLAAHEGKFISCTRSGETRIFAQSARDASDAIVKPAGAAIDAAALHSCGTVVATGGKENELQVTDLTTGACTFTARNVPVDFLDRRLPVWVKAVNFLPDAAAGDVDATPSPPHVLAIATAYRQLRVYDVRASARPVKDVGMGEYPFTCMTSSADGSSLYTGDSIGTLRCVDVATMRLMGVFKGTHGCTRSVRVSGRYLLSAGLDRCLRVHDTTTRVLTRQLYLKQRLVAAVWCGDVGSLALEPREAVNHMHVTVTHVEAASMPLTYGSGDANVSRTAAALAAARGKAGSASGVAATAVDDEDLWAELDRRAAAAAVDGDESMGDDEYGFDDDEDAAAEAGEDDESEDDSSDDGSGDEDDNDDTSEDEDAAFVGGSAAVHKLKKEVKDHKRVQERQRRRAASGAPTKRARRGK